MGSSEGIRQCLPSFTSPLNLFNMSRKLDLSQFRGEDSDDESGFAPKVTLPSQRPLIPTDRDVASSRTR